MISLQMVTHTAIKAGLAAFAGTATPAVVSF